MSAQIARPNPGRVREAAVVSPAVDIDEGRDDLVLWADLPGVRQDTLRVTLEQRVLTIEGHVEPADFPGHALAHREYQQGDFRRTFTVSDAIDEGQITATLTDGVLRLTLPKAEPARPRTITVHVA